MFIAMLTKECNTVNPVCYTEISDAKFMLKNIPKYTKTHQEWLSSEEKE